MEYQFPHIQHINDILPAIEGRKEFVVAERDDYTVVNYVVAMEDTFPPVKTAGGSAKMREEQSRIKAIRRELRGIIFDKNGNVIARRLHKFFNVNEREETLSSKIDFSKPHVILEKLDGSMITPLPTPSGIRWGTKMGVTQVSLEAETFVAMNEQYHKMADECFDNDQTPIFEWCSRKQRIVVDYPEDRLVLIAVRDNITGEYLSYEDMVRYAGVHGIEVVKAYPGTAESMEHLIAETRGQEGLEGWIVRFNDGHMVKVKGDWYVRIHKTKDSLLFEKNIVDLIVNEKIDDVKAFMLDDDRRRVEGYEALFWRHLNETIGSLEMYMKDYQKMFKGDKKQFAINLAQQLPSLTRSIMFSCWDGRSIRDEVLNVIKKNTGTQTKIEGIRHLWGDVVWNYNSVEE